ncbi:BZ3500_MvSof-1268-A1-R1_Chr4-1g06791 [Microbotryum saponariae]|uniref:Sm protein B n=1 Tax=Microbotryum saponariae TaxID=289078 RepID=A0A2X0LML8_9BASI|nr:BZ3500_MvSof-1268-A1-R1_Chr4-1g06791 [Microbotryum saponariae]SDA06448.1 BZ3501_MvSof-1269-A2-R1_Chr4-1g06493 [Microbotryum saponariae]
MASQRKHNFDSGVSSKKGGKLASIINYRVKVTLNDTRTLIGQLLAFDKYMNLVLAECEEFRRVKSSTCKAAAVPGVTIEDEDDGEDEMKRTLGLVILRGETIVTLSVQGPPPVQEEQRSGPRIGMGPGVGAPAGRGMGLAPPTLSVGQVRPR